MVYSGHIFVGNEYVNTYSIANTLNKFPFFNVQKAKFFPPPPKINNNLRNRWYSLEIFLFEISRKLNFFILSPLPTAEIMVKARIR